MTLHRCDRSTHIDLLPPEVQCQILKYMPDMKTLRTLLRASPRYLQVYQTSKQTVLSHIAWNQITPVALPIALAVLEQQERHDEDLREILDNALQTTLRKSYEIPLETSKMLLRFHENIEFFISDFPISRLPIIENYLYPERPHMLTKASQDEGTSPKLVRALSKTEYSRLARAFYHLELFSSLFFRLYEDDEDYPSVIGRQSHIFLQSLQDWELEELLCVRDYLIERLTEYLNQVEEDFIQRFLKEEPHIIEPKGPTSRWSNVDWFFSNSAHGAVQLQWLHGCLSRGLENIRVMLTADSSEGRFDALGDTSLPQITLLYALNSISNEVYPWTKWCCGKRCKNAEGNDDAEKHNAAWSWAVKGQGHPRSSSNYQNPYGFTGLRRWGYMIWDYERLQSLKVLSRE